MSQKASVANGEVGHAGPYGGVLLGLAGAIAMGIGAAGDDLGGWRSLAASRSVSGC